MTASDIVRAWTDEDFRASLTSRELSALPAHPAGSIDAEVDQLMGAFDPANRQECPITTFSRTPCCF